ncbi:unnamed protein product [Penicillium salamii]|nr:unnamed protein product [Penicillium salamii]
MPDQLPPRLSCTCCHASGHTAERCWRLRHQAVLIRHLTSAPPPSQKGQPHHRAGKGRGAKQRRKERRSALAAGGGVSSSTLPSQTPHSPREAAPPSPSIATRAGRSSSPPVSPPHSIVMFSPRSPSDKSKSFPSFVTFLVILVILCWDSHCCCRRSVV